MSKSRSYGPWVAAVVVLLGALAVLLVAWWRNDWDLEAASMTGDAAAPLVGIASLLAIGAALWSVRQQREAIDIQADALAKQEEEIRSQKEAFAAELKIQQEALELQRKAHEAEITHRRHSALRETYAPLLSAIDKWLDEVEGYWKLHGQFPTADRDDRAEWMHPVADAHDATQRCLASVRLVDTKRSWKARQAARVIRLNPVVDSLANQIAYREVIHYKMLDRRTKATELQEELLAEFGVEREERPAEAIAFEREMMAEAKAKADAVEAQIHEQYRGMAQAAHDAAKPEGK